MGMSLNVVGFVPPDEKFQKMRAVYDACTAAGVGVPDDVNRFFGHAPPDPAGVEVCLRPEYPDGKICTKEWNHPTAAATGFEVDLDKVPKHIRVIRFYAGW